MPYQIKPLQHETKTAYRLPTHNKPATQEQLTPIHLLTHIRWKKRTCISSDIPTFIYLIINNIKSTNSGKGNQHEKPDFFESKRSLNLIKSFFIYYSFQHMRCPIGWGSRIHQLHLCGAETPPTSVLDMILNNLIMRFQWCWGFGECGAPLHYHCSQVHSGPKWEHLIGPYLWVK